MKSLARSGRLTTFASILKRVDWREAALLALIFALVFYLWSSILLYPLRILVVFFHEMSHGLAAVLTGGGIQEIYLHPRAGGMCVTTGGIRFIVISAGYLGSLLWGGAILLLSRKPKQVNALTVGLGILLLGTAALLVRPVLDFGFLFCTGTGAALAAMGLKLPVWANAFALRIIGLASCMYATVDIKGDILDRPHLTSDATLLAEHTGIPAMLWGIFWMVLAIAASAALLVAACVKSPRAGRATGP